MIIPVSYFLRESSHQPRTTQPKGLSITYQDAGSQLSSSTGYPGGGGAVDGRCLLQLVMRSAASSSQKLLLLFSAAHEVTLGACRLIRGRKVCLGRRCQPAAAEFKCVNLYHDPAESHPRVMQQACGELAHERRRIRRSIAATD